MEKNVKTYSVDGNLYAIPQEKQESFLKDMPGAVPVYAFERGGKKLGIPQEKLGDFLKEIPDATPLYNYPEVDSLLNQTNRLADDVNTVEANTLKQPSIQPGQNNTQAQEPEKKGFWNTWVGDAVEKLGAGTTTAIGGLLNFSEMPARMVLNTIAKKEGLDPETRQAFADIMMSNMPHSKDKVIEDIENAKKTLEERSDRYEGKNFIDLWKEGDKSAAVGEIFLQATESIPIIIAAMLGGAAGMLPIGISVAGNKYKALDQVEKPLDPEDKAAWEDYWRKANMSEVSKFSNAVLSGTAEAGAEYIGSLPVLKYLGKLGPKAKEPIKRGIAETASKFFEKYGLLTEPIVEGVEEFATTFAENTVDYITGARDDFNPLENTFQSFVYGMAGGAQFSAGIGAAQLAGKMAGGAQPNHNQPETPGTTPTPPTETPGTPDSPQVPTIDPVDTFTSQIDGFIENNKHESGNLVFATHTKLGEVLIQQGAVDERGQFSDPDGVIFYYDPQTGEPQVTDKSTFEGDVMVIPPDQFRQDELTRFQQQLESKKLAQEQALTIDGKQFIPTGQADDKNVEIELIDENGNLTGTSTVIPSEQFEKLQAEKQTAEAAKQQATAQGQPTPEVKKAVWGKTEYQYTKNEDGTSDVLIPNKIKPEAALKEIQKHFENNAKFEAVPVTETREVPAPDDFSDPTTEDILTGIKIVPKQIATPVPSQDNKKTKEAEPKYQFGKETITKEEVAEMINLADNANDLNGLRIDNDPELQQMLLQKFPEKSPRYTVAGQEVSEPAVKAMIRLGKNLDQIQIENNDELKTLYDKKVKEITKVENNSLQKDKNVPGLQTETPVLADNLLQQEGEMLPKSETTPEQELQKNEIVLQNTKDALSRLPKKFREKLGKDTNDKLAERYLQEKGTGSDFDKLFGSLIVHAKAKKSTYKRTPEEQAQRAEEDKKIFSDPISLEHMILQYFLGGGRVDSEEIIREVIGTDPRTGKARSESERRKRIGISKSAEKSGEKIRIDQLREQLTAGTTFEEEANATNGFRNAMIDVIRTFPNRELMRARALQITSDIKDTNQIEDEALNGNFTEDEIAEMERQEVERELKEIQEVNDLIDLSIESTISVENFNDADFQEYINFIPDSEGYAKRKTEQPAADVQGTDEGVPLGQSNISSRAEGDQPIGSNVPDSGLPGTTAEQGQPEVTPELSLETLVSQVETETQRKEAERNKQLEGLNPQQRKQAEDNIAKVESSLESKKNALSEAINAVQQAKDHFERERTKQGSLFADQEPSKPFFYQGIAIDTPKDFSPDNINRVVKPLVKLVETRQRELIQAQEKLQPQIEQAINTAKAQGSLFGTPVEKAIDQAKQNAQIRKEEKKVNTEPSDAQKEAGNYQKGHIKAHGFDITIEQPKGSTRTGTDSNGKQWSQVMNNTYGYFKRTKGKDGDQIDVFLGASPETGKIFVVDQVIDGRFDEHKVMMGFQFEQEAREAYLSNYEEGWNGLGAISEVSRDDFKEWLKDGTRTKKPFNNDRLSGNTDVPQEVTPESGKVATSEERLTPNVDTSDTGKADEVTPIENKVNEVVEGRKETENPEQPGSQPDSQPAEAKLPIEQKLEDISKSRKQDKPKTSFTDKVKQGLKEDEAKRLDELRAKLRGKLGGQLNTGIDPETFMLAAEATALVIKSGIRQFKDYVVAMVDMLGENIKPELAALYEYTRRAGSREYAKEMTPTAEVDNTDIDAVLKQFEQDNVNDNKNEEDVRDQSTNTEQGSGELQPGNNFGDDAIQGNRGQSGGNGQSLGTGTSQNQGLELGDRPITDSGEGGRRSGPAGGTQSTSTAGGRSTRTNRDNTNNQNTTGGSQLDLFGNEPINQPEGSKNDGRSDSTTPKKNKPAQSGNVVISDIDNIREQLPQLKTEQQEDVLKAEQRFFTGAGKENKTGSGMLFTNGTGTGKTFSGLGIIKRFVNQGKGNVIIVVPGNKIADDWIKTGRNFFDMQITQLKNKRDAGQGISITTYANFRDNEAIIGRKFDLIVFDEAHYLSQAEDGKTTGALRKHHALIDLPSKAIAKAAREVAGMMPTYEDMGDGYFPYYREWKTTISKNWPNIIERAKEIYSESTKTVYLSATPFAYHKSLAYADGTLMNISENFDNASEQGFRTDGTYYFSNKFDEYLISNLGYRIRYNKLTRPETLSSMDLLERRLFENMVLGGYISGRSIDVPYDYSRKFITFNTGIGQKIDEGIDILYRDRRFDKLRRVMERRWTYLKKSQLLEAIKAKESIPYIKKQLEKGRKVVVFHNFLKENTENPLLFTPYERDPNLLPFRKSNEDRYIELLDKYENSENEMSDSEMQELETLDKWRSDWVMQEFMMSSEDNQEYNKQANLFNSEYPEYANIDLRDIASPVNTFLANFRNQVVIYNGTINKNERIKDVEKFNKPGSGKDIIVLQRQAGKEGISLHDTQGENQRVLLQLGLPTSPTDAIQIEGRIYRIGLKSDAEFDYAIIDTGFERMAFREKVASRSRTAENLALGNKARKLEQAFLTGYVDSISLDDYDYNEIGKGSKDVDKFTETSTPFDNAVALFHGRHKIRGKRTEREGQDFYPTPEPVGLKMMEWAMLNLGDKVLEPSAGDGAIAQFTPEGVNLTAVEPSLTLLSRLGISSPNARIEQSTFEDFDLINKYHAVVMNPPYGVGGKIAMEHVEKAFKHLRIGGRLIAIVPDGPAMDRRIEEYLYGKNKEGEFNNPDALLKGEIKLPRVTFGKAGTSVATKIIIIDKIPGWNYEQTLSQVKSVNRKRIAAGLKAASAEKVESEATSLFDKIRSARNIVVRNFDFTNTDEIDDLFENIRDIEFSERANISISLKEEDTDISDYGPASQESEAPAPEPVSNDSFETFEQKHTKNNTTLYMANPTKFLSRDDYNKVNSIAKKYDGYYSSYQNKADNVRKGFAFKTEESRSNFISEVTGDSGVRFRRVSPTGYYSTVENALDRISQERGTPEQFKAMLLKNAEDRISQANTPEERFNAVFDSVEEINRITGRISPITIVRDSQSLESSLNFNNVSKRVIPKIIESVIEEGDNIPGFFYDGRIYIISDNIMDANDLIETWLHEAGHSINKSEFTNEELKDLHNELVDQINDYLPKSEHNSPAIVKADESISYAVSNLLRENSLENILTGNVDIDNLPLPLQFAVNRVLQRFNEYYGTVNNQNGFRSQEARQGNERGSRTVRQNQEGQSRADGPGSMEEGLPLDRILKKIIGERGASNLDAAEESNRRMKDLEVAKEMEKGTIKISNKNVSDAFLEMAQKELDALENVLFNLDDIDVEYDRHYNEVKLKANAGRNTWYSTGMDSATYRPGKKDIIKWLLSEKPFDPKEFTQDEEWLENIGNLRKIAEKYVSKTIPDAKTIRLATGWEKGADGKWRYEMPDGKFTPKFLSILNESSEMFIDERTQDANSYISEILGPDSELLKAYPSLDNILTRININPDNQNTGRFTTYEPYSGMFDEIVVEANSLENAQSILIHEIQHAIQEIEGFAKGGNLMSAAETFTFEEQQERAELIKVLPELEALMNSSEYGTETRRSAAKSYVNAKNRIEELSPKNRYNRLAGEVEARNAATRMDYPPEQRRETTLQETEDIPRDQQIITGQAGESRFIEDVLAERYGNITPDIRFKRRPPNNGTPLEMAAENYAEEKRTRKSLEEIAIGMREFFKDMDFPIRKLQEEIKDLGGKITDNSKPYRDIDLSKGRLDELYNSFVNDKMKPVLTSVSKIIKSGISGEEILPYVIAKHGLERNADLRAKELQDFIKKNPEAGDAEIEAFEKSIEGKDYAGVLPLSKKSDGVYEYEGRPDELADDIITEFESKVDKKLIDELWKNMKIASTETLKIWKAGNSMSEDEYKYQLNRYNFFVPLRDWRDGAAKQLLYHKGQGFGKSLVHAEGRKSLAENPLAYIQKVAFKALGEQVDNEVRQATLRLVLDNYNKPEFKSMYEIKTAYYVKNIDPITQQEEWTIARDVDGNLVRPSDDKFKSGDAKIKVYDQHERLRTKGQAMEHEVMVKQPNQDVIIVFKGKNLPVAHALNKQNTLFRYWFTGKPGDMNDWNRPLAKTLGVLNNTLKAMYTSYNVVFPFTNFFRDAQEASLTQWIKGESGAAVIKNYKNAFPAIIRSITGKSGSGKYDKMLKEFYESGGATGFTHEKTAQEIEKELNKKLADMVNAWKVKGWMGRQRRALVHSVEAWNRIFEDATRFSVYMSAIEQGFSQKDAASQAKEASVNFNRKGKSSKSFDAWWAFWNVALESMFKNFGLAKRHTGRFSVVAGGFFLSGVIMALLNDMMPGDDDDDYFNIGDFARHNYLLIPNVYSLITEGTKGDKYLRIPLPQFWRGFYASGSLLYDTLKGKENPDKAVTKSLMYFIQGLSPVDIAGFYKEGKFSWAPLFPTVTRPIVELKENRDFMGYQITREPFTKTMEETLAKSGLHQKNVNPAIKLFTDFLFRAGGGEPDTKLKGRIEDGEVKKVPLLMDINPSWVEHLLKGYTGGTGAVVSDVLTTAYQTLSPEEEVDFKNVPFINAFIRKTPEAKWKTIGKYYELKEALPHYKMIENAYKKQALKGGDPARYKQAASNPYAQQYITTLSRYQAIIDLMTDKMDMQTAEGSEKVLEQMENAIKAIEELNKKYGVK